MKISSASVSLHPVVSLKPRLGWMLVLLVIVALLQGCASTKKVHQGTSHERGDLIGSEEVTSFGNSSYVIELDAERLTVSNDRSMSFVIDDTFEKVKVDRYTVTEQEFRPGAKGVVTGLAVAPVMLAFDIVMLPVLAVMHPVFRASGGRGEIPYFGATRSTFRGWGMHDRRSRDEVERQVLPGEFIEERRISKKSERLPVPGAAAAVALYAGRGASATVSLAERMQTSSDAVAPAVVVDVTPPSWNSTAKRSSSVWDRVGQPVPVTTAADGTVRHGVRPADASSREYRLEAYVALPNGQRKKEVYRYR